ncbi:hypothetical protein C8A05DRAFT_18855, partial [Staphylotrichum tortipilum]
RYTDHNHLGRVVSGSSYNFDLRGPAYHGASLSPLLRVNQEAGDVALVFYHIRLPFPGREQVLYLNSNLDFVQIRTYNLAKSHFTALLLDFLHDARAYDIKDQGIAHLMLDEDCPRCEVDEDVAPVHRDTTQKQAVIHPVAAVSFADILRLRLRSLSLVLDCFELESRRQCRYHFAQTLPLARHGLSTGAFRWLNMDPRPGVELDLPRARVSEDPHDFSQAWDRLERAFGITDEDRAARARDDGGFRLHFCVTSCWSGEYEDPEEDEWSRDALAHSFE